MEDNNNGREGWSLDSKKSFEKSPNRKARVHYPLTSSPVQVEKLVHKPSWSVMGRIDIISMLRTWPVRLSGVLDELWVQSTQILKEVSTCWVD